MKVLAFKMTSGEEVLARVNSTQEDGSTKVLSYEIENPMTLMVGQGGLGLIPWALANPEGTFKLPAEHVILAYAPAAEIEKQFLQRTSKIALA